MANSRIPEIRDGLVFELHSMGAEGSSSTDIIERFKKRSAHLIRSSQDALTDIALMKILNQVRGRKTPVSAIVGHPDLFLSTYEGPRIFSVPASGRTTRVNVKLKDMTCDQLQAWCIEHGKLRDTKDKEVKEAERMLDEIKDFRVSAETTVEEALEAAEAARKAKDGSD